MVALYDVAEEALAVLDALVEQLGAYLDIGNGVEGHANESECAVGAVLVLCYVVEEQVGLGVDGDEGAAEAAAGVNGDVEGAADDIAQLQGVHSVW